ncbi:radical SAM protein [Thiocapsa imhoffii]|uniref:Radical SAM protein n=1 Tax=Thiocapsa imhoffii TaxID=382777 RepID=A0A9X0WFL0_9GAMM|nr:radical SAM protein [Thiocapsa imhoffii]MBK1643680.1 radical SAM protein [Thiocapsa imhoffii]
MDIINLTKLGLKHSENALAERLRIQTGYDLTKPVTFYGIINERCNIKCRQCEYWRLPEYKQEITIQEWQSALISIKQFVGEFFINFSGGEPYLKKGFIDLLAFAHRHGIHCGITTSGFFLTKEKVTKTVSARPFNVNISVDAPNPELHDYLRGKPGLFVRLSEGIQFLLKEQKKQSVKFPIIIKPTINRLNFRLMPDLVKWTQQIGATAINFQPVNLWTTETYEELWIEEEDQEELTQVIEHLIEMKKSGAPIMNSDEVLRLYVSHFHHESASESVLPCRVGLRNFLIEAGGEVKLCNEFPSIGNIKEQSAKEIWYSEKAREIRQQTLICEQLCLMTCVSQKTIAERIKMGLKLLRP